MTEYEDLGPIRIFIVCLRNGEASPFDGKWLAEYDPTRKGKSPEGRPMIAHLVVTDDPDKALKFDDAADAVKLWLTEDGKREDGKPNRPLSAFTVEFTRHKDPIA